MVFYADVYFLINFTVNVLALYFSAVFTRARSTALRLTLTGGIGAAIATLEVLVDFGAVTDALMLPLYGITVALLVPKKASPSRRIKCMLAFFILEMLIGGAVSYFYTLLDKYLYTYLSETEAAAPNRRLLVLSLIILLMTGIIKLLSLIFSHTHYERVAGVEICFLGRKTEIDALVDSGNLLKDPMTGRAVILMKREKLTELCPNFPGELDAMPTLPRELSSRIVLIPSGERLYIGFRPDGVKISENNKKNTYNVDAVVASDTEGGTFGGFFALLPSAVLDR